MTECDLVTFDVLRLLFGLCEHCRYVYICLLAVNCKSCSSLLLIDVF